MEHAERMMRVEPGTPLVEALRQTGMAIDQPCGGRGDCGKCRVRLFDIDFRTSVVEDVVACRMRITKPIGVKIPFDKIVSNDRHRIVTEFTGDAVHHEHKDISIHTKTHSEDDAAPVLVVDLGTTTLAATLVDPVTERSLAVASQLNPQTQFGADVISRIEYVMRIPSGDAVLRGAVIGTIFGMAAIFREQVKIPPQSIRKIIVAGNTTMQNIAVGIDVRPLGEYPFTPVTFDSVKCRVSKLGAQHIRMPAKQSPFHRSAMLETLPVIGGFVGGDIVAGLLATRFADAESPALFLDIGTNGEIVLRHDDEWLATATAAGPAFEGARIRCGMRATTGAIHRCGIVDGMWQNEVIENSSAYKTTPSTAGTPISGICGSALPDAIAALLDAGIVTPDGRILPPDRLPTELSNDLRRRVIPESTINSAEDAAATRRMAFLLADTEQTYTGGPVYIAQRDIREVQLASGAIRTGIELLLHRAGVRATKLKVVYLAGGFGNVLSIRSIQRIGMLPPEIEPDRIRTVGNSSLAGAVRYAISEESRKMARSLARRTPSIDLSTDPAFQRTFAESMRFPTR